MDSYVVILSMPLTAEEADFIVRGQIEVPVLAVRRMADVKCFAAIKESDFMAVAGLHALPLNPERMPDMGNG